MFHIRQIDICAIKKATGFQKKAGLNKDIKWVER